MGRARDGKLVFVPFVLPGERVLARTLVEKASHRKASLVSVLEPSPERIEPRCPHYRVCGGCHYQHMKYEHQLAVKQQILRDQLIRIGRFD